MRQNVVQPFNAQDATVNPANSPAFDLRQVYALTMFIKSSSGSNAGALKLQVSNDPCGGAQSLSSGFTPTNWVDLTSATVTVTAGANAYFAVNNLAFSWGRLVWTPSAGAGTITTNVNTQGF